MGVWVLLKPAMQRANYSDRIFAALYTSEAVVILFAMLFLSVFNKGFKIVFILKRTLPTSFTICVIFRSLSEPSVLFASDTNVNISVNILNFAIVIRALPVCNNRSFDK